MAECKAKQFSDLMSCDACKLSWDMNDQFPPPCKQTEETVMTNEVRPSCHTGKVIFVLLLAYAAGATPFAFAEVKRQFANRGHQLYMEEYMNEETTATITMQKFDPDEDAIRDKLSLPLAPRKGK